VKCGNAMMKSPTAANAVDNDMKRGRFLTLPTNGRKTMKKIWLISFPE
jgi:hypothetical protein